MHTELVTGSATSSVSISTGLNGDDIYTNIDGDRDEEYLLKYWFLNRVAGVTRRLKLRPTGATAANAFAHYSSKGGITVTSSAESELVLTASITRYQKGEVKFRTLADPGGGVEFPRVVFGSTLLNNNPLVTGTSFRQFISGGFQDSSPSNITSLQFVCTAGSSTTLQPDIDVGSRFEVWRLVR